MERLKALYASLSFFIFHFSFSGIAAQIYHFSFSEAPLRAECREGAL
jgi:hypothetical protein